MPPPFLLLEVLYMATYFTMFSVFLDSLFDLTSPFTWVFWGFFVIGIIYLIKWLITGRRSG